MTDNIDDPILDEETTYCEVHPDRDTGLRCNRCNRYMCMECAVRTPVGYTCKECVRGHEDKFFEGTQLDYVIVGGLSFVGSLLGAFLIGMIGGFWLLTIVIAPAIGGMIGQVALNATGRRRGRQSGYVCAGAVLVGGLMVSLTFTGLGIGSLLYMGLATSAAYASFKVSI